MRKAIWFVAAGVLVFATVALAAPAQAIPCQAGPTHGDGKVRRGTGPWFGKDAFNCTAAFPQSVGALDLEPGDKKTFDVKYKNDSGATADVTLVGSTAGTNTNRFKFKALRTDKGDKDVKIGRASCRERV